MWYELIWIVVGFVLTIVVGAICSIRKDREKPPYYAYVLGAKRVRPMVGDRIRKITARDEYVVKHIILGDDEFCTAKKWHLLLVRADDKDGKDSKFATERPGRYYLVHREGQHEDA